MVHIDRVIPHDARARVVLRKLLRAEVPHFRRSTRVCARVMGSYFSPDDEVGHRNASQQPLRAVGETVRVKKMSCAHGKPGDRRFR